MVAEITSSLMSLRGDGCIAMSDCAFCDCANGSDSVGLDDITDVFMNAMCRTSLQMGKPCYVGHPLLS